MRASDPPVQYLVGTPKGRLSKLEQLLLARPWQQARENVAVKLLPQDGELYVLCRKSRSRRQGAGDAPTAAQMAVETAGADLSYEARYVRNC